MYRVNDLPKDRKPSTSEIIFHNFSDPHKNAALPGLKEENQSELFKALALVMSLGFVTTTCLGLQMALQNKRMRKTVVWTVIVGVLLPIVFLCIHS